MTKRVTVSLPDDLASRLEQEPNASAYVADALRTKINHERTMRLLAESGYSDISPEDMAEAAALIDRSLQLKHDPDKAAQMAAKLAALGRDR